PGAILNYPGFHGCDQQNHTDVTSGTIAHKAPNSALSLSQTMTPGKSAGAANTAPVHGFGGDAMALHTPCGSQTGNPETVRHNSPSIYPAKPSPRSTPRQC